MLDPTQKYECDAGEVIALHGPDDDGDWLAIIQGPSRRIHPIWVGKNGSHLDDTYNLRPARPKLHVKCWLVVWECEREVYHVTPFFTYEAALKYARGRNKSAILPIDTTLTAGDGMEEQS